jgi:signal recognition particle receptor subunit alpha
LKADSAATDASAEDAPLFEQAAAAASPEKGSSASASSSDAPVVNQSKLAALQAAARSGKPVHSFGKKKKANEEEKLKPELAEAAPTKKVKVARTWDGNKATKKEAAELDYAVKRDGDAAKGESVVSGFDSANREGNEQAYSHVERKSYSDDEEEDGVVESDDEDETPASSSSSSSSAANNTGGFFSYFKTLVAGKVLERSDLEPVLTAMKENLNGKNVAAEISEQLAESVIKTLEGQKLASFTSVKSMVKKAVEAALTRILTPNRQIDVLAGVAEANEQKRPYSIVFVGVNGVGKVSRDRTSCSIDLLLSV